MIRQKSIPPRKRARISPFAVWLLVCITTLAILSVKAVNWKLVKNRNLSRHVLKEIGYFGYLANEVRNSTKSWIDDKSLALIDTSEFRAYLHKVHSDNNRALPPISPPKRKHLIYIQMESVDAYSIEATFEGEPIMPFLNELSNQSLYFENAMDLTSSGRSTDGEFLALTSLPPVYGRAVYHNHDLSKVPSLPRALNDEGYYTFSIHGNNGAFWNRAVAHAALGYQKSFFKPELNNDDTIGWGISDRSILSQAIDKIKSSQNPCFAHIILLTNHHPYNHVSEHQGIPTGNITRDHFTSLRYVDQAIESFFNDLEANDLLEECIIAIYSDHDSSIQRLIKQTAQSDRNFQIDDSIPLFVVGTENPPQRIEKITSLLDLPVVTLDALGVPIPHTFVGHPIRSNLPTLTPKSTLIKAGLEKPISEPAPFDSAIFTKMAIVKPERLDPIK